MSVKEVLVTARGANRVALVDADDYGWASSHRWFVVHRRGPRKGEGGESAHAARHGYRADGVRTSILMHREIFILANGPIAPGIFVDHVNHDSFDNRRANLRLATMAQNNRNTRPKRGAVTAFKGVDLARNRWRARIMAGGRRLLLGYFDTAEEAARAYDQAAREHFGEFAVLNFATEGECSFAS